jgi:thiamine pyrophosphokinase
MGQHPDCVIVVSGGGPAPADVLDRLPSGAPVVAADSGIDSALALGLHVDVAVGDFDSVTRGGARRGGSERRPRHPPSGGQDATDLALGLDVAVEMLGETSGTIIVVGADAGRLDTYLAGSSPWRRRSPPTTPCGATSGRPPCTWCTAPGPSTSMLRSARRSPSSRRRDGGRYHDRRAALPAPIRAAHRRHDRGVSNVVDRSPARVEVESGTVLVVLPGDEPEQEGHP